MPKSFYVAMLAGLAFASASSAQDRFDLNCRIDVLGTSPTPRFNRSGREHLRIRVDLANHRFCFNDCDRVEVLTVSGGTIRGASGNEKFLVRQRSGEMEFVRDGLFSGLGRGVCDTASFSGFPRRGFGNARDSSPSSAPPRPAPQSEGLRAPVAEPAGPRPYLSSVPSPAAAPSAPLRSGATASVQIGAFSSPDIARAELAKVAEVFHQYLQGSQPLMENRLASNGQTIVRTSFGNLSPSGAADLCAALQRAGRDCIVR